MPTVAEIRLTALSDILWRQRRFLDLLRFKLEEERLLLVAGRTEWVARASHEIGVVLDELAAGELDRAVAVADVAAAIGLGPQPTLAVMAAAVEAPWTDLLRAHRQALRAAERQVERASEHNRSLLREHMAVPVPLRAVPDLFDHDIEVHVRAASLETALATSDRILLPSLRDFLG